jgi:hypothetical protein
MEKTDGKNVPIVLPVIDANEDPENETLHPNIPQFPTMCCIYANFRSGKSVLLVNYLLNSDFYRNRFDRIYLYSPTAGSDPSTQALTEDEGIEIISEPKEWESHLNALWDYQTETKNTSYEQKIAICLDDCVGNLGSRNSLLATIACKSRHINCRFLCYISQSFKSLHPSIRSNTKSMIIMKLSNDAEREKIKMEVDGFLGGNFETLYNYAIKDQPYSFLYLDFTANPCNAYLRHERLLYSEGNLMLDHKVEEDEEN